MTNNLLTPDLSPQGGRGEDGSVTSPDESVGADGIRLTRQQLLPSGGTPDGRGGTPDGSGGTPDGQQPWLHCPVCHDTRSFARLSKDMIRLIRKLRRDLNACSSCSIDPDICPILANLNITINTALHEILEEWNIRRE